jgi:hypothetical protein
MQNQVVIETTTAQVHNKLCKISKKTVTLLPGGCRHHNDAACLRSLLTENTNSVLLLDLKRSISTTIYSILQKDFLHSSSITFTSYKAFFKLMLVGTLPDEHAQDESSNRHTFENVHNAVHQKCSI